jgi:phospholipid transport system substrate-binding protein
MLTFSLWFSMAKPAHAGRRNALRLKILALIAVCCCLGVSPAVAASRPLEVVQTGTDRVLQVLKTRSADNRERREELRKIADEYFDFQEMSKRALGPYWNNLSPQKQKDFVDAFSEFLFNEYARKIENYTNEAINFTEQEVSGNYSVVESRVIRQQGNEITIIYRLHQGGGAWMVYDVVIEGVSLVDNYRSQFRSILAKDPFEKLLDQLRRKNR